MALGALAGAAIGGLASAGGGFALNKLFGSKTAANPYSSLNSFSPVNINAGGLSSSGGAITASPERMALVSNIAATLDREAAERARMRGEVGPGIEGLRQRLRDVTSNLSARLGAETEGLLGRNAAETAAIRARIAPGVSELRQSRLQEIEDARNRAIGNLRENMAQRRVLGSSFGQDALARADREFGDARAQASAESTMQEIEATRALDREAFGTDAELIARRFGIDASMLDSATKGDAGLFLQKLEATNNLLSQEFNARTNAFKVALDDLNFSAEIAAKLAAGATSQLGANSRLEAELRAKEAAGQGKFFGQISEPIGKAVSSSAGKFFNGLFSGSGGGTLAPGDMGAFI